MALFNAKKPTGEETEKQPISSKPTPVLHKKKKTQSAIEVRRFNADANEGLSQKQVDERIAQGLVNKAGKKYSKSYRSIFVGNICTFFNLLCAVAAIALLLAHADISQFLFVAIFLCNIVVSIVQEIRAKRKIDKLTILSSPIAHVIRSGKHADIPVEEIVVDDILILSTRTAVFPLATNEPAYTKSPSSFLIGTDSPVKSDSFYLVYAVSNASPIISLGLILYLFVSFISNMIRDTPLCTALKFIYGIFSSIIQ